MKDITKADAATRARRRAELAERYAAFKARGLALDMTRGKPCPEQLDLSLGLLDCVSSRDWRGEADDYRNYGLLEGIPEAKRLFADYLGVGPDRVIVGGNASLPMMHAIVRNAMLHGVPGGAGPWSALPKVRFLCPSPGYDRHFTICQYYGIEMITVAMTPSGPDMNEIERLVADDDSIKGIWCVPMYSNPTGITFSDEVVERLARMRTKAPDFRVLWDNAYAVHHLYDTPDRLADIARACERAGNPDRPFLIGSTAKISFAGGGVGVIAASRANIDDARRHLFTETIGYDKLNQLRHVRFFRDMAGIEAHMRKHAAILRPKFEAVEAVLARELGGTGTASWTRPNGGYFVSIDLGAGCAQAVVELAADAGVKLTPAGATYPYGRDPTDRNLRIAPSFPSVEDVRRAMELFAICVQLVAVDRAGAG
jgi:DNA-binding transcriptional MocR family regulator